MPGSVRRETSFWPTALMILLIVAGLSAGQYVFAHGADVRNRNNQVHACKRIGNPRAQQITRNGEVLSGLILGAIAARSQSATVDSPEQAAIDRRAVRRYRALLRQIAPAPVVNCEKLYPKP